MSTFGEKVKTMFGSLWSGGGQSVVAVDVGTAAVKVVQVRKERGRAILETYGEMATGPYRDLAVGQAAKLTAEREAELLRDLFREANVTTAQASFAIPLGSSLLFMMEMPGVAASDYAKVVPIEARKYIPVPISEVALDWWVIPDHEQSARLGAGKVEVLVAAIHNRIVSEERALALAVKLDPAFFEIETFSAIRAIFPGEPAPTVILDFGAGTTKLAIVDYGIVRVSHTINKGSQDITVALSRSLAVDFAKAEEIKRQVGLVERLDGETVATTVSSVVEYIFADVNKVITAYQGKYGRAVGKIVFSGGGALLKGLLPLAEAHFKVPVVVGKPFEKLGTPAFLQDVLAEAGPGFSVAVGLALRHLQTLG